MSPSQKRHKWSKKRIALTIALVFATLLLIIRVSLPVAIEWGLNERILNNLGDYSGHVEDVDLALIRGAYVVESLTITKNGGEQYKPFLSVRQTTIGVDWRALTQGELFLEIIIREPKVNFEDAANAEDAQSGQGGNWQTLLDELTPVAINTLHIHNGELNFFNRDSDPKVHLSADKINLSVANLTNIKNASGERIASAALNARLFGSSPLSAEARFDPFDFNDFSVAVKTDNFQLKQINDFARAYGNLDFAQGHGNIYAELQASNAELNGYIKPFFEDVEILDWQQDVEQQNDGVLQFLWEGAVDIVESIFNNQKTNQLATQIDIEGTLDNNDVQTWGAVWGVVKNAFFAAFEEQFNRITPLTPIDEDANAERTGGES
ncbi:DUF748 domain-containing protein [Gilvimarinus agarilyticus]|uniref:DUF748 domain-containing protein n=1 Tax=Gilvimarinus sp. 2_MG-2023 TaxID=3062666 RepID=UPI001C0831FC|nr:DUF748 domain-containing protein [Gilvimarinus sp. 2_MG-2023]MBU2885619.1 DUF748 domain-containing protein [Gilvimarinus agarilyticus]MDO6570484.1 DUF748 domain-containing protein [Gilvimarinus sp. 2_MG-2023]